MRELQLLQKIYETYKALGLNRLKMVFALFFMLLTSLLEMAGLSVLYPLVLSLSGEESGNAFPLPLPEGLSFNPSEYVFYLFLAVAVIFVVKNVAVYFTYEYNINFAIYFFRNLMRGLYSAHLKKPLLEFQKESAGSLSHLICVQTQKMVDGSIRPMMVVFSETFIFCSITVLVFFINPTLMLLVIAVCGVCGITYFYFMREPVLNWGKREMVAASKIQEIVSNSSRGVSEIKIFHKEKFLTDSLYDLACEKTRMFHHQEMHQQGPRYIAETSFIVTLVTYFLYLLSEGANPAVLLAQFAVMAAASFRLLPSINRIVHSYSNFSFNVGPSTLLIDTILDSHLLEQQDSERMESKVHLNLEEIKELKVSDLEFRYPDMDHNVLNNVNLKFCFGEKVGIVGDSGSGKSTLIKVIAGLFAPLKGQILADGVDISKNIREWHTMIGYVPQESFIYPGSLVENVAFGQEQPNLEKVRESLDQVGLWQWANERNEKLETRVGDKGVNLSGGQRQLLCLARALYRDPKVLLLDEPTASLDAQNEQIVLDVIQKLSNFCITIMVSHKHENFKGFDKVFSFDPATQSFERDPTKKERLHVEESRL